LLWFFCALVGYAQTRTEEEAARYYNSGVEYYNTNRFDLAVADFTQAIMLIPNNANYYLWRGRAYAKRWWPYIFRDDFAWVNAHWNDVYERAIADFEAALRLDPSHTDARKELADAKRAIANGSVTPPLDVDFDGNFFIGPPPPPSEW
jgi:tetratricopeptide (TPR) repeat protein